MYIPFTIVITLFKISCILALAVRLLIWGLVLVKKESNRIFSRLLLLLIFRVSIYSLILIGWSSKNKYRYLGRIRGISQNIRYEIRFAFIFISFMVLIKNLSLNLERYGINLINFSLTFLIFIIVLIEVGRSPFDLQEADTELISGFNIEYSGILYGITAIREFLMFLLFSYLIVSYFNMMDSLKFLIFYLLIILLVRGCYPRIRYDKLIIFAWLILLPITLFLFVYCISE